mmetsp:Transcript_95010/g.274707  ORF Transcript_95010/g.274707 Transcript_95010/m.274707 type:complete len:207 (-) Transcript_95010:384-1004(-)
MKGSPDFDILCNKRSAKVCESCNKSIATKLTWPAISSFCFFFFCALTAAFFARFKRFSRREVLFAPTISLATSATSPASSWSLSSRMPSKPFVLLPRNKWAKAAASLTSGCTNPALIKFTTCASLQTFFRYNVMKAAAARRATSTSPSFILTKKKSRNSLCIFWLRVLLCIWLMSLTMCVKICRRNDLSEKPNNLKYSGNVRMHGN